MIVDLSTKALSAITVFGNGSDPHTLTSMLSERTMIDYYGTKNSTGLAPGVTSMVLTHTDGTSAVALFDDTGRNIGFRGSMEEVLSSSGPPHRRPT